MSAYFEPLKEHLIEGQFNYVRVNDPAPPGHTGNLVINRTEEFTIDIEWELKGSDVALYLNNSDAAANWAINVFAESMGPGPELVLYHGSKAKGIAENPKIYQHRITVPANSLPEHVPGSKSGMYKLVVTVFLNDTSGFGYDIAGCHEGPMIMVENPV